MTKGVIGDIITLLSNAGKSKRLDFGKSFLKKLEKVLDKDFEL